MISIPHSVRLAFPYPGISSSTTLFSPPLVPPIPNAFISLVRPGLDDVQQTSWPMMAFKSELFPTLERPRNATSGSIEDMGVVRNLLADHNLIGEWRDGMKSLSAKASWAALGGFVSQYELRSDGVRSLRLRLFGLGGGGGCDDEYRRLAGAETLHVHVLIIPKACCRESYGVAILEKIRAHGPGQLSR